MCEQERVLDMETEDNTHFCETCNSRHCAYGYSEKCVLGHQKYFTKGYFESFSFVESRISNINCLYINIPDTKEAFLVITYDEKELNGFNVFKRCFYRHVQQPNKLSAYTEIPRILTKWVERYASTAKQFDKCNPEEELWAKFEAQHIHKTYKDINCFYLNRCCAHLFLCLLCVSFLWILILLLASIISTLFGKPDDYLSEYAPALLFVLTMMAFVICASFLYTVDFTPIGSYRKIKESVIAPQEYKQWTRKYKENWIFKTSLSNGDLV
jgi:hypothetical protein